MSVKRVRSKARRLRADESGKGGSGVGYGRPPTAHQFKPGQSGNKQGRPKGAKNESTILRDLLHRKIEIREGGRIKKVSILEAIHLRIAEDSLKGNTKSAAFLLNRYAAMVSGETPQAAISEDDEQILQAFINKLQNQRTQVKK